MRGSVDGAAEAVCFELFTSISLLRSGWGCVDDFCAPTAGSRHLRRHCGLFFGVVPLGVSQTTSPRNRGSWKFITSC